MTDNFDFSQLKSVKTPENWIETAVNIPQKKKPLPFILRSYVIGTAASLVIVAAAVLTILPILAVYLISQRYVDQGISLGGLK